MLVAEVLSPSTQRYDRGDKRMAYACLPSLQDYALIAQDRMRVELYTTDGSSPRQCLKQPGDILHFQSVGFSISLAELYE